jgi:parallel beta-helix repeat protein
MSTTVTVSSTSALESALASAKAGETIQLAAGVYSGVTISNHNFSSPVTITSANASHPAILEGLKVGSVSNLNFTNLEMTTLGSTDPYFAFRVSASQNVSFSNIQVQGDLSKVAGAQMLGSFYVSDSSHITITDSSFNDLNTAVLVEGSNYVTVSNNAFQDLSKGGVEVTGTSNLTVSGNNFTDFATTAGVHGDCIQVYTESSTASASNIVITGNVYDRGSGVAAQGIFVTDDSGVMPYHNVTIDDNTMIGADWNAIELQDATGTVQLENNHVESFTGYDVVAGGNTAFESWIRLSDLGSAHVTETGNVAQFYLNSAGKAVTPPAGNTQIGVVTDGGASMLHAWATASTGDYGLLSGDFLSMLGVSGVHSSVGIG